MGSLRWTLRRVFQASRSLLPFALAFQLLNFILLAPLATAALHYFLTRWGRASVGNFEIAAFLLTGPGLLALVASSLISLVTLYFEIAGIMRLIANPRLVWWQGLLTTTGKLHQIILLGLRQLLVFFAVALPFLAVVGLAYVTLWGGRDIYPLVVLKPPAFWIGGGIAAASVLGYALVAGRLALRWLFALPALLFEPVAGPSGALTLSWERTRGRMPRIIAVLAGLLLLEFLVSVAVLGGLKWVSDAILERLGTSLVVALPATVSLVVVHGLLATALSMLGVIALVAVILALYRETAGSSLMLVAPASDQSPRTFLPSMPWLLGGGLVVLVGVVAYGSREALQSLRFGDKMEITAHRAGAAHAPENTIAALRGAVADRADWAEIDVVRTADDRLVVMHDTDLVRVGGGDRRRVRQVTLAEIEAIDVGSQFSPEFAGERIPTFEAFLAAASEEPIRLNVELKPRGADDVEPLTRKVVEAIQQAGMVDRCRICSQSYPAIQLAREIEPRFQIGFIAATALGDLSTLDVDYLMVSTKMATRRLVRHARLREMDVHVWSIKDTNLVAPLLDLGVANIITDQPAEIRARLDEIRALDPVDRLFLRVRTALTE